MEQVQDAVVRTGLAVPVVGRDGQAGDRTAVEGSAVVEWMPSVPVAGRHAERGMVSAEWAVGIVAAVAIAGVLLAVVTSGVVKDQLSRIVLTVLKTFLKFT